MYTLLPFQITLTAKVINFVLPFSKNGQGRPSGQINDTRTILSGIAKNIESRTDGKKVSGERQTDQSRTNLKPRRKRFLSRRKRLKVTQTTRVG